ncbi:MAG: aspartyl-phosphate phosphatase Spo0E family protein [Sporomusaceae bacterium]|nr:aspartyl-phosphate phosphatase Spo0E family protein [Sporomusaceae bacterium]
MDNTTALLEQIETLRASLHVKAAQKGLDHHKVIALSEELDEKLVQFLRLQLGSLSLSSC